jgi:polysaccharide export outer membrane protein
LFPSASPFADHFACDEGGWMLREGSAVALAVALCAVAAPLRAQTPAKPAAEPVEQGTFRIGPADELQILVWGNTDLSRPVTVRPDGYISLPLLNDVRASGLTPMQLRDQLKGRFSEFIPATDVFVIVAGVHSFQVTVIGKVNKPGHFELRSPTTVLDVLAQAGGLQEYAHEDEIFVLRRGPSAPGEGPTVMSYLRLPFDYKKVLERGGESRNFAIVPNDIVVVP